MFNYQSLWMGFQAFHVVVDSGFFRQPSISWLRR